MLRNLATSLATICKFRNARPARGIAGIYQRPRYAKEVRDAFELWSQHIETLTAMNAAAA